MRASFWFSNLRRGSHDQRPQYLHRQGRVHLVSLTGAEQGVSHRHAPPERDGWALFPCSLLEDRSVRLLLLQGQGLHLQELAVRKSPSLVLSVISDRRSVQIHERPLWWLRPLSDAALLPLQQARAEPHQESRLRREGSTCYAQT